VVRGDFCANPVQMKKHLQENSCMCLVTKRPPALAGLPAAGRTRPAHATVFFTKKGATFLYLLFYYEPSRNSTGQACRSNQRPTDHPVLGGLPAVGRT
jgi:hypothetical protein